LQPPQAQPQVPWPTQGQADHGQPAQAGPAYHFPPPEPEPNYGYNQPVYAPQWGQQGDQRGYDLANYLPSDGPPPFQQVAHHQQAYAEPDPDYGDEYYEDEEPRRSRRWILIAAALIGAIGVGGALAYTYRSLIAPNHGRVPVVKADPNIKVKPEARGGKAFPGSDRKLPNRHGEGTLTAAVPPPDSEAKNGSVADDEKNLGPRKIKTIPVGPQPGPVTPPVSGVPGITLENMGPPSKGAPKEEEAAAPPEAADPPAVAAPPKADKADDDPPAPPAPPPATTKHVVAKAAAVPPPAARPPSVKTPSSGLGYVAVVSSQKTHMDALKAYADAAEKHPEVLSGKIPDVQEANLGEKGIWYRAVVGPPGSRDAAVHLCSQLKAAGHGCWVKEY
jgi:hypothetical protein